MVLKPSKDTSNEMCIRDSDKHAEDAQRRAKRTADDGNPLIVQSSGLDHLADEEADYSDDRHSGDTQRRKMCIRDRDVWDIYGLRQYPFF